MHHWGRTVYSRETFHSSEPIQLLLTWVWLALFQTQNLYAEVSFFEHYLCFFKVNKGHLSGVFACLFLCEITHLFQVWNSSLCGESVAAFSFFFSSLFFKRTSLHESVFTSGPLWWEGGGTVLGTCGAVQPLAVGCLSQIASGTNFPRKFLSMERLKASWERFQVLHSLPYCFMWLRFLVGGLGLGHAALLGPACRLSCWDGLLFTSLQRTYPSGFAC